MIGMLMEKRASVGTDGDAKPLSEVRAENDRFVMTDNNASTIIQAVTQMDLPNIMKVHWIESVAQRRAKLDQLQTGQVGNQNVASLIYDFMNQMNANVTTLVNNTTTGTTTAVDSTKKESNLINEYKEACELYKKAKEENAEDDQAFYSKMKANIMKRLKDMDN